MDARSRMRWVEAEDFQAILTYHECPKCGYVCNDHRLSRVGMACSECGETGYRSIFPDMQSISLLELVGHFYKNGVHGQDKARSELEAKFSQYVGVDLPSGRLLSIGGKLRRLYESTEDGDQCYEQQVDLLRTEIGYEERDESIENAMILLLFYNLRQPEHATVVLHTCALLETLLRKSLLEYRVRRLGESWDQARQVLDNQRGGLRSLLSLHNEMCGVDFHATAVDCGYKQWSENWKYLSKLRNRFLHGRPARIALADANTAMDTSIEAGWVFAQVRNRLLGFVSESDGS